MIYTSKENEVGAEYWAKCLIQVSDCIPDISADSTDMRIESTIFRDVTLYSLVDVSCLLLV
jgi:hypothetical protein